MHVYLLGKEGNKQEANHKASEKTHCCKMFQMDEMISCF